VLSSSENTNISENLAVNLASAVEAGQLLIAQKSRMEIAVRRTVGQVIDLGLALGFSAFIFSIASWLYKPGAAAKALTFYFVTFDVADVILAIIFSPCIFVYFRWWFKNWSHSITPGEMITGIASYYLPGKNLRHFVELEFAQWQYLQVCISGILAYVSIPTITLILGFILPVEHVSPFVKIAQGCAACATFFFSFLGSNYPKSLTDARSGRDIRLDMYLRPCAVFSRHEIKLDGKKFGDEDAKV
jgi:hypothetical protein